MEISLEEFTENKNLYKCKVVKLDCAHSQLTILPDISALINLTDLYCYDNLLTNLSMFMNELGISKLTNLTLLDCSNNELTDLSCISALVNLTHLHCSDNKLTELSGISTLINLTYLECCHNKLTDLSDISALINLAYLYCTNNKLTDLSGISALINLTELYCAGNKLTDLSNISALVNLEHLGCVNNRLTNLSGISALINLTQLYCSGNILTDLSNISALVNLTHFGCGNNRLTNLPHSIITCRQLKYFNYTNNPIEYIPPNIQRFIQRMNNTQTVGNIYSDIQSVHRSSVTNSVKKSIENLLSDRDELSSERLIEIILEAPSLTEDVKNQIIQYMEDKEELVSSMVTFEDVLSKVIARIIDHVESSELYKILNEQMTEAECMCLTGRISRLVSTLDGFYDDIRIEVSSTEIISAIILQVTAVPGTVEEYKDEATRRLLESGYTAEEIEQWIASIE